MMKLTSADMFVIKNRGTVYTFDGIPGFDGRTLRGQQVNINGVVHRVKSVESYALLDTTSHPFGLLVEESTAAQRFADTIDAEIAQTIYCDYVPYIRQTIVNGVVVKSTPIGE